VKKEQQWPTSETQASSETELQCFTCRVDTCPLKKHPMNWKRWIDDSWDRWLMTILYGNNPSVSNCPKCIRMILNIMGDGYQMLPSDSPEIMDCQRWNTPTSWSRSSPQQSLMKKHKHLQWKQKHISAYIYIFIYIYIYIYICIYINPWIIALLCPALGPSKCVQLQKATQHRPSRSWGVTKNTQIYLVDVHPPVPMVKYAHWHW